VRIDPARTHDYATTSTMPTSAPDVPWAVYLAGTDHRYRLLAFDFDSGRHGADAARLDADRIAAHLADLGVEHLRTHSGPTGGQHVWVRLDEPGAAPAEVRQLAHALRQHYPTLDTSPLSNAATGAVRPPGAPHRNGGHSLPHHEPRRLTEVLNRMAQPSPIEIVEWLLARHPHTAGDPQQPGTRTVRIVEDAAGPHLDRPRRPLAERTRQLLAAAPLAGTDRSALAHSILLGMARSGHTLADVVAAIDTAPGLVRLREDRDRGRDDTERQWQRALATAAQFPAPVLVERSPVDDELDRVEESLTADPSRWARPGGASDERILHALIVLARTARTRTLDIDVRRLAEAAAVDASTVSRRLRVLRAEGWVTCVKEAAGTRAATWELSASDVAATQGEPAPRSSHALLDHHTHDVWANRHGLGGAAARIHWAVLNFGEPAFSVSRRSHLDLLVSLTGYTVATLRRVLRQLKSLRLIPSRTTPSRMTRAAEVIGAAGTAARRSLRHLVDRELHRWWTEEVEWRARRGKKRGVATDATTLSLPIAAPARARYGRFPTTAARRADYRTARGVVVHALDSTVHGAVAG